MRRVKLTTKRINFLTFVRDHPGEKARGVVGSGEVIAWAAWERLVRSDGQGHSWMQGGFRYDAALIDQPLWLTEWGAEIAEGFNAPTKEPRSDG